jgi:flagellar hook-associated protein 1 FlgK
MASGIFGIGLSGLAAAQAGLVTTGHNIANASTPGFHRQEVVQTNSTPQITGAGFIGSGVRVDVVRRIYSDFLESQVGRAQAQASYYGAYSTQVSQIEGLLADPNAGLAPTLQSFFEGVHGLAADPSSVPSRGAMLSAAESLATRFRTLDTRMRELGTGINAQVESTVATVNSYAREIAALNNRITSTQIDPSQPPNDLLDQRGQLIAQLNELVGATAIVQSDGNATVTIGSGQALVVGTQAYRLAAVQSAEEQGRTDVAYVAGASASVLSPQSLNGGSLGALLSFRAGTLADSQNELGRIAAGLAQSFNAQHRAGQDLRGALGGDFFNAPTSTVYSHAGNSGGATVSASIVDASGLEASDYRLVYTGGAYQLTRLSDNSTQTFAGLPQTVDGISISLAGAPGNGDSFLIQPTRNAARDFSVAFSDTARIAAAAPIRTASSLANVGSGAINGGEVAVPLDANVQQPVTITFTSATTFNVTGTGTGNPVGVAYAAGTDVTYNGWTVRLTGAPAAGDTFSIGPNNNGIADNRNALALADLQGANTLKGGTTSYQGAYGELTSAIGNAARDMNVAAIAQDSIAASARTSQQSMSGVNLDEEAANLLRFQQSFQASSKVIQVASTLFDTILGIR